MNKENVLRLYPFINSKPFRDYSPQEFAEHLKSIVTHTAKVKKAKALRLKLRRDVYKVIKEPIYVTFRILKSGRGSIIIRKREEPYVLEAELELIKKEFPKYHKEIFEALEKRSIPVLKEVPDATP